MAVPGWTPTPAGLLGVLAAALLGLAVPSPAQPSMDGRRIRIDTLAYEVRFGGERLGVLRVSYDRTEGGRYRVRESISGVLGDEVTTYVITADLRPVSARREGRLGAASSGLDLRYREGRVSGDATVGPDSAAPGGRPDDTRRIEVDRELPERTLDSNTIVAALLASPLSVGDTLRYPVFRPGRGVVGARARVVASEAVSVPAGRYDAYRVELSTDQGEFTLWVTRDPPRMLVRQAFRGRPVDVALRSVGAEVGGRAGTGPDSTSARDSTAGPRSRGGDPPGDPP